jgi:hypothetical protein
VLAPGYLPVGYEHTGRVDTLRRCSVLGLECHVAPPVAEDQGRPGSVKMGAMFRGARPPGRHGGTRSR